MRASLTLITILGAFLLSFQAYGQMQGKGMMNMSMIRHHFVMRNGVDPKYASKVNLLERNVENIAAGKKLYEKSCALCHGMTGLGDGKAGKDLKPPPANIAMFIRCIMFLMDISIGQSLKVVFRYKLRCHRLRML